jgi:hypothetical protein
VTSPLPPKRRDTRGTPDLFRQDRTNLRQLNRSLGGGRVPNLRPLVPGMSADDTEDDEATFEIAFENEDRKTAAGPGTLVFPLTYEPLPGSLHIRWSGLDQPPTEWTVDGSTVIIPDPNSLIQAGDVFTAAYAYEPIDGDAAHLLFVGYTAVNGAQSSVALPPDTQLGDLIVFASASANTATASDPRLTGTIGTSYGPGAMVKWGTATTSTANIACAIDGGVFNFATTIVAVFRGVTVTDFAVNTTATGVNDITLPVETDASAAIGVLLAWDGTVSGLIGDDTTLAWTFDAEANSSKNHIVVDHWTSDQNQSTPPGAFHHSGDWNGFMAVTLKAGGIS